MLDLKLIRENPDIVRDNLKKRGETEKLKLVDDVIKYDKARRELQIKIDELKHKKNLLTKDIAEVKGRGKDISKKIKETEKLPEQINKSENEIQKYENRIHDILMRLPNLLHESVPVGKDDSENVEIKKWGNAPKFDFMPKNHLELASGLGLIDQERSAKVAGAGFYYLKNELVVLDYAVLRFAIDFMREKGYTIIEPPFMLRRKPYEGVVDLDDFENVMYKIENDDLYLIATSEHPIAAMFIDEVLLKDDLPLKFAGVSPCFRREVGTHGKYTKGLFRMHHFNKVEQFIFCLPEHSWKFHEEVQQNAEQLYQRLGLHYRVVNVCTGDIGSIAAKKYDTEVWTADGQFREIGSNSNCTDYQARRLNIKFREKIGGKPIGFVHTINNTALATSRTMLAILEQYQQKDGSIDIPKVLWPYMNGIKIIGKK